MIRIIEGTDGVGKTTHARWLARELGDAEILHYGPHGSSDPNDIYVARVATELHRTHHVVMDRSAIGSLIWSGLGFHPPTLTPEGFRSLMRWYARAKARALIVVRPDAHIAAELNARPGEGGTIGVSLAGQRAYIRMLANRDILYVPVALATSDLLLEMRNTTTWN